jgi:hypothetical protein
MQDLLKDWKKWTRTERAMAVLLATATVAVPPALIAIGILGAA